jgi:hypothetical protein
MQTRATHISSSGAVLYQRYSFALKIWLAYREAHVQPAHIFFRCCVAATPFAFKDCFLRSVSATRATHTSLLQVSCCSSAMCTQGKACLLEQTHATHPSPLPAMPCSIFEHEPMHPNSAPMCISGCACACVSRCACVCKYECVCVLVCVHVHLCVHTCVYYCFCVCICVLVCVCVHLCVLLFTCVCVRSKV